MSAIVDRDTENSLDVIYRALHEHPEGKRIELAHRIRRELLLHCQYRVAKALAAEADQ